MLPLAAQTPTANIKAQMVMSQRLSGMQWLLLLACIYAAMLTERAALASIVDGTQLATTLAPYLTLGVQYLCSICGNLANEKLLKDVADLSVNAQNCILYAQGSIALTLFLLARSCVYGPVVRLNDLPEVFEWSVMLSIITLSLLGISAGFLLKTLGNVWKELAGMVVTFIAVTIDWCVLKRRIVELLDCQAVVIVAMSLTVYSLLETVSARERQMKAQLSAKGV